MAPIKVKLEICGSSYVVSTNDSEEYLVGLAERLDKDMNQMMLDSPNASVTAAAVITALGYLDEAEKSAFGADNMRGQIQGYLEDASKARLAAEEARREVERLRRELAYYEGQAKGAAGRKKEEPLLDYGQAPLKGKPAPEPEPREETDELNIDGQMGLDEL